MQMNRAPSCERGESSVGGLIDGEHQGLVPPVNKGEMPAFDLLHRPELHHPLVSRLEPSDGRRPNDLQPFPFLFRERAEDGIIRWRE